MQPHATANNRTDAIQSATQPAPEQPSLLLSKYAWYVLGLLCVVYVMNFLDRTLIYILFPPIKKEMVLTDVQLALLGSTSFAIFYTVLGIPFGRLADRVKRTSMIAVGLMIWSVFSGLTGVAQNFWTMFACRVMVGVGEATLGPAALSLLSDYFPPRMRATVQSIYSAGIPLGSAAAFALGGWVNDSFGWRWAFYLLSFPGLILALLVWLVREPQRGITEIPPTTETPTTLTTQATPPMQATPRWQNILAIPALYFHTLGYASAAIAANCLSIWIPSLLNRGYGMPLRDIGSMAGLAMLIVGGLATAFGGLGADKLRQRSGGGRMKFTAIASLVCVPLWLVFLFSDSMPVMIACYFLLSGSGLIWLGPAAADVHDVVGPALRGFGVGVYFFVVVIIGYGIAPPLFGFINDALGAGTQPMQMRYSLMLCPLFCLLSALLLWQGSRLLDRSAETTIKKQQ